MLAIIAQSGLISCSGNDGLLLESPNSFDESKLEISSILNTRSSLISPDSYLVSFEDAKNIRPVRLKMIVEGEPNIFSLSALLM